MKKIILFLVICLSLALCACDDDSKPGNHLPGGSVKRTEQVPKVEESTPAPLQRAHGNLPGGSVRRN